MTEQMMKELFARLDALSAKVGEGAEFVWQATMRQVIVVDGWLGLASGLLLLGAGIVLLTLACRGVKKYSVAKDTLYVHEREGAKKYGFSAEAIAHEREGARLHKAVSDIEAYLLFHSIGGAIGMFSGWWSIFVAVSRLLNPQYYVLLKLAEMLGK